MNILSEYFLSVHCDCLLLFLSPSASPVAPTIIASSIFITSTSVRLVWNQISDDDARGVVIGYNFRYGLQNGDLQTISVAGHVESHEFPGLTPASNYQFAVSVHNVNGSGPYSDFAYVTTKDDRKLGYTIC